MSDRETTRPKIDARLRSAWSRQILRVVTHVLGHHGIRIPPPHVEVVKDSARLGSYNPATRTLSIAETAFTQYPWDIVDQLIRHELAHCVCHELFGPGAAPHGQDFVEACRMVGLANPAWHRSRGELHRDFGLLINASRAIKEERGQLDRVRKLLAMADASRSSEHEARIALEKAHVIMRRHNLDTDGGPHGRRYSHHTIDLGTRRVPAWEKIIWWILRDFFFVLTCREEIYDPWTDERRSGITFVAEAQNLEVALYVRDFLHRELARLYAENRAHVGGRRNQYFVGLVLGFQKKIAAEERTRLTARQGKGPEEPTNALIVARDPIVQDYFRTRFPRTRVGGASTLRQGAAFRKGMTDGGTIALRHGVTDQAGNKGRLLGR